MAPSDEPTSRFAELFEVARKTETHDASAACLATVDAQGRPSARMVLLKSFDERGFVFFTDRHSRKGQALRETRLLALNFHWPRMECQIAIEGTAEPTAQAEDDAYFATRPRESQVGAWASLQSALLASRELLEIRVVQFAHEFKTTAKVPRPPHWGGFRLVPARFEFWKAHPHRLHWREEYLRRGSHWARQLLFP